MFVEMSKTKYENLKQKLQKMGISVEVSDCTTKEDIERILHIEFPQLSNAQKIIIQKEINAIYGKSDESSKFYTNDFDGNGISDDLEDDIKKEETAISQNEKRTASDDHYVSVGEAFSNFTKGDDEYEPII